MQDKFLSRLFWLTLAAALLLLLSRYLPLLESVFPVAIEGKPVDSVGKLLARLDDFKIGEVVSLSILRDGHKMGMEIGLQAGS